MFDLCQCETGVQMEDNEGGIGEKEICKYTCSSWRSTVAFLSLGDSDEPVAKRKKFLNILVVAEGWL